MERGLCRQVVEGRHDGYVASVMDCLVGLSACDDDAGTETESPCRRREVGKFSFPVIVRQLVADLYHREGSVLVLYHKVAFTAMTVNKIVDVFRFPEQMPEYDIFELVPEIESFAEIENRGKGCITSIDLLWGEHPGFWRF